MSPPSPPFKATQIPYYAQDVDFSELAKRDPDWAAISRTGKETKWLDFQDPKILMYASLSIPQRTAISDDNLPAN